MANSRGRPNKYDTHIKPRLKEIEKLALSMTEKQIAQYLGISQSAWCDYKNKYSELNESIKKGREALVVELKSTLIKKAKGFEYSEKKVTKKKFPNGEEMEVTEEYTKYAQPDTGAIHLLLKNLDDKWHNDDKTTIKLKEKQMELNQQKVEQDEW